MTWVSAAFIFVTALSGTVVTWLYAEARREAPEMSDPREMIGP